MRFQNNVLHINGVSVDALAARYGTPLYLYDAASIRQQIENVRGAFASLPFRPMYAMKANSNKCLNVSGGGTANGTPVEIRNCDGSTNQAWTVTPDSATGAFKFKHVK